MKSTSYQLADFKDSIFGVMSKLALEYQAINLSQGFPDFDGEDWIKKLVKDQLDLGANQYAPYPGTINLRNSISSYYEKFYQLKYDPINEVSVFVGATEAIYVAIKALVNPGDEVIVLEPFYDSYVASIKMSDAIAVPVTMHSPEFTVDLNELKKSINSKTKLLILNNPHNPTGKVWSQEELSEICKIVVENDLYLLSDEVYEFLVFDGNKHIPSALFEGMKERTLTISSAGKTFGLTGWKIGWICAPERLSKICRLIHQYITFSVSTPMQEAVAIGLTQLDEYLPRFVKTYQDKRDYFHQGLKQLGFDFKSPQGTYFMMVPTSSHTSLNDVDYAMKLIKENKVATVPPSSFYLKSKEGEKYLRFCFAKKEQTLKNALEALKT